MLIIVPLTLILFLVVLAVYFSFQNKRQQRKQLYWFFRYLRVMHKIIQHVPQHRGMANAYLKGDYSFKPKMLEMQKLIIVELESLRRLVAESSSIVNIKDVIEAEEKWVSIEQQVFSMLPADSFNKHTFLVTSFLNMMEDSSELTTMGSSKNSDKNKLLITAVIRDIPHLTEMLGQARGLGTGVAAQAECTVANRIKLNFIYNNGMKVLSETIKKLLDSHQANLSSNKPALDLCWEKTNNFLLCMKENLIEANKIDINPAQFYSTATEAIDVNFNLLSELLGALEKEVLDEKAIK